MKFAIVLLLGIFSLNAHSQCLAPYQDFNNNTYVFDAGTNHYLENLPLQSFKVGRDNIMAYIAANNQLRVYYKGQVVKLNGNEPQYYMTDYFFLYNNFSVLKVLYNNDFLTLDNMYEGGLYYGDSMIVWRNVRGDINIFYRGITQTIERTGMSTAKMGPNVFAYMDPINNFKIFYQGELRTVETYVPNNFQVSQDIVMYIDQYNNYKFFMDGQLYETNIANTWNEYQVGRGFGVYLTTTRQLAVYYKGEETILLEDKPAKLAVKENIIAYTDKGNSFWCWYKGKKYWLERYVPLSYKIDNDILVYQDLDGRLKAFYYGEQVQVSDQIVKDYTLYNEAVTYSLQPFETKIWCNKKTYTFK